MVHPKQETAHYMHLNFVLRNMDILLSQQVNTCAHVEVSQQQNMQHSQHTS